MGRARFARRGTGPVFRTGAACALTAALVALAAPAAPASAATLISNVGQPWTANGLVRIDRAQRFRTGPNAAGYTLTGVSFPVAGTHDLSKTQVRIESEATTGCTSITRCPSGTFLGTLSLSQSGTTITGTHTGISLSANTNYYVVLVSTDPADGNTYERTSSNNEDANGASGWSIDDGSLWSNESGAPVWKNPTAQSWKIAIQGTINNNAPTVANAIPNQAVKVKAAFSYQFPANTFNDVDAGTTLTYTATKGDGSALPNWLTFTPGTRTFSGTPENANVGTLSVKVTASDSAASVSDTFNIVVSNDAPTVANAILNQPATVGRAFSYQFPANTFHDANGQTLTYTATKGDGSPLPNWLTFTPGSRTFSGTPMAAGTVVVKVTASDGNASVADTFDIRVSTRPAIASVAIVSKPRIDADNNGTKETYGRDQNIAVDVTWNEAVAWDVSAAGAGIGVQLRIGTTNRRADLVTGGATSGTATTLRFTYTVAAADSDTDGLAVVPDAQNRLALLRGGATLKKADGTVNATVFHAGLSAQSGHLVAGGTVAPGNSAPTFSGTPSVTVNAPPGESAGFAAQQSGFSDPDGDPLTFTLSADRGSEAVSDLDYDTGTGRVSFRIWPSCVLATRTPALPATTFDTVVTYTAADPDDASAAVTGTMRTSWGCPAFSSATVAGTTLTITLSENTPSGAPGADEFEVKVAGTAVALASANPVAVSGKTVTLTLAAAVTRDQTVTVSYAPDADSLASKNPSDAPMSTAFSDKAVTNDTPTAPTVANAIPNQSATVNAAFSYQFPANTFDDDDGDTLTYTATKGDGTALPSWLTFTAGTRTFSGTPTAAGTVSVKVTATDDDPNSVSDTFDIDIVATIAPTAEAGADRTVNPGETVTLSGSGTDSDGTIQSYAWSQVSGTTVTLQNAGTAQASFTAPETAGPLVFRLTVTDNLGATGSDDVTVTVNDVPPRFAGGVGALQAEARRGDDAGDAAGGRRRQRRPLRLRAVLGAGGARGAHLRRGDADPLGHAGRGEGALHLHLLGA